MNASDGLRISAWKYPDKPAAVFIDKRYNYKELDRRVNCLANGLLERGFKRIEVTNFSHPVLMPQTSDAEEVMKQVYLLDSVRENRVHLKVYAMTVPAFQRIAECVQKGYGPHEVTFTISNEAGRIGANEVPRVC